jgi:hypothetical protein
MVRRICAMVVKEVVPRIRNVPRSSQSVMLIAAGFIASVVMIVYEQLR